MFSFQFLLTAGTGKKVNPAAGDVLSAFQHMKKYPEQTIQINLKDRIPYSPASNTADAGTGVQFCAVQL